ncbi:hypothetical protein V1478_011318 [Vespula squamosa]|uniref:Uncharacterized protein n=1 Tax=Vespula squamosa TaxID=30214 RepID=A0ABD2AE54_VESSQ
MQLILLPKIGSASLFSAYIFLTLAIRRLFVQVVPSETDSMKIWWEVKIGGRCVRALTVSSTFDARQDEKQQASMEGRTEGRKEGRTCEEEEETVTRMRRVKEKKRPRDNYQIEYEVLTVHLVLYGNGSRIHLSDKVAKLVASNLPVVSIIVNVIIRRRKQVNGVSRAVEVVGGLQV